MAKPYTVERTTKRTITVRHGDVGPGWERRHFLASDIHGDHPDCRWDLLGKHLDQAKDADAGVWTFGDLIDGTQGLRDPRANKGGLDADYAGSDYTDRLVDVTAYRLEKWHDIFELVSFGNHEGTFIKHHETNIVRRLADAMGCQWMGYTGYIRLLFEHPAKGKRTSRLVGFAHGRGGNSPVTRGAIQTARRAVYQSSPDILVSGDLHQKWNMYTPRILMSKSGKPYRADQLHIQLGTYLDGTNLDEDAMSWADEKEFAPVLLGGYWLIFRYDTDYPGNVAVTCEPAV